MLNVSSRISDATWPAVPTTRASQLLAVQFQLEQSQWLTAEALRTYQLRQLHRVLVHSNNHVPLYRDRIDSADLPSRSLDADGELQWDDWLKLPLLQRDDVQAAGNQIHTTPMRSDHGTISQSSTSGSTATPLVTLGTTLTRLMWSAISLRQHLWAKRDLGGKLCSIRKCSEKSLLNTENWGLGTLDIVRTGPAAVLDIHAGIEKQAQWLVEQDPDYLLTFPTIVAALIDRLRETGQGPTRLREVRTFGEALDPYVRRLCREHWGVPVSDVYSSEEFGYIAIQCPEVEEHYHIQSENVLVEILDEHGSPCKPGEVGQVVITGLQNFAMPLIRYAIGDYAELGAKCECGRGLPVLRRILGRQRNIFVLPNGEKRWPVLDTSIKGLSEITCVRQFQVVQSSFTELDVNMRVTRPLTEAEQTIIRATLESALGYPFEIRIHYVDSIERGSSGKFEDYRCDIEFPEHCVEH